LAIHKFTYLIDKARPITFYGDGSTSRDYTFIKDIVNGIDCALQHLSGYHIYNLGESKVITLNMLVETIENELGKKAILHRQPLPKGDVNMTFADITKAKNEIGYNPEYDFQSGIHEFVKWYSIIKCHLFPA
jgi:UDP-glucuronate 4-epimerase